MAGRTRLGNIRAYWLGVCCCMGGFLFGYDTGVIGGVLSLASFEESFGYTKGTSTTVSSLSVGLQSAGAFVACLFVFPVSDYLGRKKTMMICSTIFCVGALIQVINTHSLAAFYIARVISGVGIGGASVVIPTFCAEMAPPEIRGRLGSFWQWMFTFGVFSSYWIDWGVQRDVPSIARQWQIPVGLQLVPGALLGLLMLTLKESVRWLAKKGRDAEAWESLKWMRADDSAIVVEEFDEIKAGVAEERTVTEGLTIKELFQKQNLRRFILGFAVFTGQQATGATALAYFAPQFFSLLVGPGSKNLLITGVFGAVKVVACSFFIFFLAERFNRRTLLIGGALLMAACMIPIAVVDKVKPPPTQGATTSAGIGTVALIMIFIMIYNCSWGPLPWPYVATRSIGIAIGVSSQWLFNFVFSFSAPYMIANMGWGTFLLLAFFNLGCAALGYFFMKETKGQTLEHLTHIFDNKKLLENQDYLP